MAKLRFSLSQLLVLVLGVAIFLLRSVLTTRGMLIGVVAAFAGLAVILGLTILMTVPLLVVGSLFSRFPGGRGVHDAAAMGGHNAPRTLGTLGGAAGAKTVGGTSDDLETNVGPFEPARPGDEPTVV
jgi:hypothetical protein